MSKRILQIIFYFIASATFAAAGENYRQISSREGLTNNAALSLMQDTHGYIWIGTCEGLNRWNGKHMESFPLFGSDSEQTSGNLIEKMTQTSERGYWLKTNYGFDYMESEQIVEHHREFFGMYYFATRSRNETVVLTQGDRLFGYNEYTREFDSIPCPEAITYDNYLTTYFKQDGSNSIWTILTDGIFEGEIVSHAGLCRLELGPKMHSMDIEYAFCGENEVYIVDNNYSLMRFAPDDGTISLLSSIPMDINHDGRITAIIRDGDDILISFLQNGVLRLSPDNCSNGQFRLQRLEIECGVFSLLKDANQDIVWVGTDGQGVYMVSKDEVIFRTYRFEDMGISSYAPVRALYKRPDGEIWIGTKGEGIIRLNPDGKCRQIKQSREGLISPAVYAFESGPEGIIWIGTEGRGINWYDPKNDIIKSLKGHMPEDLKHIHAIRQSNSETLWIATVGCGVFRCTIGYKNGDPFLCDCQELPLPGNLREKLYFFSLLSERDGSLWFGNRGGGLLHHSPTDGKSKLYDFGKDSDLLANDIWSICRGEENTLWLGTSSGLIGLMPDGEIIDTPTDRLVHEVAVASDGRLWLTTNSGLYRFDPESGATVHFDESYGVHIIEFCDGAIYTSPQEEEIIAGGINGFVSIRQTNYTQRPYTPEIKLQACRINDTKIAPGDYSGPKGTISIPPRHTLNSLTYTALDFKDGANYKYQFRLSPAKDWTETPAEIRFTGLGRGRHQIQVRYINPISGYISPHIENTIIIYAPRLVSIVALVIYALLSVSIVIIITKHIRRRKAEKHRILLNQIESKRKEEETTGQILLLRSVVDQFATPLSLISIPAEQIAEHTKTDDRIRGLGRSIIYQSNRLEDLFNTYKNFSRSAEDSRSNNLSLFRISDFLNRFVSTWEESAIKQGMKLNYSFCGEEVLYVDSAALATVINTMVSLCIAHGNSGAEVSVDINSSGDTLVVKVRTSGQWLSNNDASLILEKMTALDYLQKKASKGEPFLDEIRLASCGSGMASLHGSLKYECMDNYFSLTALLARITTPYNEDSKPSPSNIANTIIGGSADRSSILIYGHDQEIIFTIAGLFAEEYDIKLFSSPAELIQQTKNDTPDIIIIEEINRKSETEQLIRDIKGDKITVRIPVILIGPHDDLCNTQEEIPYDMMMSLPLNAKNLKTTVRQSIRRLHSLQEYYASDVSIFEFSKGRVLHSDDRKFLSRMYKIICNNISDPELDTTYVAEQLNMSVRNLYHRLSTLVSTTPKDIIRDYRLAYSEQLLIHTRLSVDEVIERTGFVNRGTFFRNFAKKYGSTPSVYRKSKSNTTISELPD